MVNNNNKSRKIFIVLPVLVKLVILKISCCNRYVHAIEEKSRSTVKRITQGLNKVHYLIKLQN